MFKDVKKARLFVMVGVATAVLGTAVFVKTVHARKPAAAAVTADGFPLAVGFDPTGLTVTQQQVYQSLTNALNGYTGLPDNRTAYFSAYNAANGFTLWGWGANITSVQQNVNGYQVTLTVGPGLSSDTYGAICLPSGSDYSEVYQVNNDGTFQYLDSLDPQGNAGILSPNIAGL